MLIARLIRKGNKVKILFDDSSFIIISYEVAMESGLRKNDEITEKRKEELITCNELYEIKSSAFRLLARRLHSKKELKNKLAQKKFRKDLIEQILDDLEDKKYLDDVEFAERYASEKISLKKIGVERLKGELFQKGIARDIIDSVISKYDNDPLIMENALVVAQKKMNELSRKKFNKLQKKQKLYQFLRSKGFQGDVIGNTINLLDITEDE